MVEEEIEVLQSIYGDELFVERNPTKKALLMVLSMKIRSAVLKYGYAASAFTFIELPKQYPKASPKVYLRQPRGLNEKNWDILQESIEQYIEANSDMPILYDIFQMIQKFLETAQSVPCAACPICLNGFSAEATPICTSSCDHYIHLHCFVRYVNYSKNDIERELNEWPEDMKSKVDQVLKCPVCRAPLNEEDLSIVDAESINLDEVVVDEDKFEFNWKEWQAKLEELQPIFERQKANGGLIDLEEERKRYLITDEIVFGRQPVAESSQRGENNEAVELVEDLSTKGSCPFSDHRNYRLKHPYSIYRPENPKNSWSSFPKDRLKKNRGKRGFTSK